jgi:hypothetical protein
VRGTRNADGRHAGSDRQLAHEERRAARGAARLAVVIGEQHAVARDAVDVGGVTHHPVGVGADIPHADVVTRILGLPAPRPMILFFVAMVHLLRATKLAGICAGAWPDSCLFASSLARVKKLSVRASGDAAWILSTAGARTEQPHL